MIVARDVFFWQHFAMRYDRPDALNRAIAGTGGVNKLARAVGLKQNSVSAWRRVPAEHVIAVSKASGVPRHELRPDLYPPDEAAA